MFVKNILLQIKLIRFYTETLQVNVRIFSTLNLKADLNILVLLTCESTETGAVMQRSLYQDLFNQNGMDFVTEIYFCKTLVADEKMLLQDPFDNSSLNSQN